MSPEGVTTTDGRLATFQNASNPAKRRASNTRKRAAASIAWPHSSPTAEDLAKAGFFFNPSSSSPDNTQCFACGIQLDGWESGDDPVLEHFAHNKDCYWAIIAHTKHVFDSRNILDEDPLSERNSQARTDSFQASWPHESKKGWKCKIKKLVEAGWFFDPSPADEDCVSCAYCGLSLGGWEPKDDPTKEHKKRGQTCPFFELVTKFEATRVKPKKGKGSRQSKASRVSNQSVMTVQTERSSFSALDDDIDNDTIITVDSVATTASKAPKSRRGTATSKKGGRKKKTAVIEDVEMPDSQVTTEEEEKPKRAPRRVASRVVSTQVDVAEETQTKPKRQTRAKKSKLEEPKESSPQRELRTSETSLKDASIDTVIYHDPEEEPRASRGTKRTSDGLSKSTATQSKKTTKSQGMDSSVIVLDEAPTHNEKPTKLKRGKKVVTSTVDEPMASEPEIKSKKGKAATKRQPLGELEPEVVQKESERIMRLSGKGATESENDVIVDSSTPKQPGTPVVSDSSANDPPTPTPARVVFAKLKRASLAGKKRSSLFESKTTAPSSALQVRKQSTPSIEAASPQSSDAENKPPSTRPEAVRKALQLKPVSPLRPISNQLQQMTPKRASPSKFVVSRLRTSVPWSPADVEAVMRAASPSKYLNDDKENIPSRRNLDQTNPDKMNLSQAVEAVKERLTSPEGRMTVEEWIRWRAEQAEERLKRECETLVTAFERDGERAMRALEGIELDD